MTPFTSDLISESRHAYLQAKAAATETDELKRLYAMGSERIGLWPALMASRELARRGWTYVIDFAAPHLPGAEWKSVWRHD